MTYGCYNRKPLLDVVSVQDGWVNGVRRMIQIPNPNTKECQYTLTTPDTMCSGCKHERKK